MRAKARLTAWAMWRLEPRFSPPTNSHPLARIMEDRENAGAGGGGMVYDMADDVPCAPDGGLGDIIDRMAGAIEHDARCREVDGLVTEMRYRFRDYWNLVDVTFSGTHPRDVMKGPAISAQILGIDQSDYRSRMRSVYEWLEGRLGDKRQ